MMMFEVLPLFFSYLCLFTASAEHTEPESVPDLVCERMQSRTLETPTPKIERLPILETQLPSGEVLLLWNRTHPVLLQHNCLKQVALYARYKIYVTQDLFSSPAQPLSINQALIGETVAIVTDATFTSHHLLLAINGRPFIYNWTLNNFTTAELNVTASGVTLTNLAAFPCCDAVSLWCKRMNMVVLGYDANSATLEFARSLDEGRSFHMTRFEGEHQGPLYGLTVINSFSSVVGLIKLNDTVASFVFASYDVDYDHVLRALSFDVESGHHLAFQQILSGFSALLVWDNKNLYYSPSCGQTVLPVHLYSTIRWNETSFLSSGETFRQIITGPDGEFAAVTTENRLFYGREGHRADAVEIYNLETPLRDTSVLLFSADGDFIEFYDDRTDPRRKLWLKKREIDLQQHLRAIEPPLTKCQYQALGADFQGKTIYIDINTKTQITVNLIPQPGVQNQLLLSMSNPHLLQTVSRYVNSPSAASGLSPRTLVTSLNQKCMASSDVSYEEIGVTNMRVTASERSLVCSKNPLQVGHVSVGCPPGKHVRIKLPPGYNSECDVMKNFTYTIPKFTIDPTMMRGKFDREATADLEVKYDYQLLGCPISSYHNSLFKPEMQLWQGDTFLEDIHDDFIMYEIHGMKTYSYTKKIKDAGCDKTPQTWAAMLLKQQRELGHIDPSIAWTKMNYESCKVPSVRGTENDDLGTATTATPPSHRCGRLPRSQTNVTSAATVQTPFTSTYSPSDEDQYEILGGSGDNKVSWKSLNLVYIFEVIVLSKDHSFCDLRTKFAVQVWGAPPKSSIPVFLVTGIISAILTAIVYCMYATTRVKKKQEEDLSILQRLEFKRSRAPLRKSKIIQISQNHEMSCDTGAKFKPINDECVSGPSSNSPFLSVPKTE